MKEGTIWNDSSWKNNGAMKDIYSTFGYYIEHKE
jgi:hypothetical protein